MRAAPVASLATALLLLSPAPAALAGGSDDPTPYTVTADGLRLPRGAQFDDGEHVNIRYTVPGDDGVRTANFHVEALNNQPSGRYIGTSYLPWDVLTETDEYCITWVQVGEFDEHFGEGGQEPVCTEDSAPPAASPVPSTGSVPSPDAPAPSPSAPAADGDEPSPQDAPPSEASPSPTASGSAPAATPSSSASASPVADVVASPSPTASPSATAAASPERDALAFTGSTALPLAIAAAVLVLGGAGLLVWRARRSRS